MKCSFCGKNIKKGLGKVFVKNDGSVYYLCSSKCEKNYKLGRSPKKIKWVKRKK